MARKTLNVADFVLKMNITLAKSTCNRDVRVGIINTVEEVLHSATSYKGFRYLTASEVPVGELPGVNYDEAGILPIETRFVNTDNTRIEYFV